MFIAWAAIILLCLLFILGMRWLRMKKKKGMLYTNRWPDGRETRDNPTGGEWGSSSSGLFWQQGKK
jgi:hypothetical protein